MQIKTKIDRCHTADSKPVKLEVNGTVILSPLVFPGQMLKHFFLVCRAEYATRFYNLSTGGHAELARVEWINAGHIQENAWCGQAEMVSQRYGLKL
jgi:hypothetical protein